MEGITMPYMTDGRRDYKKQQKYDGKPSVVSDRAQRNAARALLKKEGVSVSGKDVAHKKPISKGGSNDRNNLMAMAPSKNKSFPRRSNGAMK
jgi:5-methylcytosine-specific restriction endonuclease McrA